MRRAGAGLALLKVALVGVVGVFIWRSLASNWSEFSAIEFEFRWRPLWIALSALVTWLTYAIQIASWRIIVAGWQQRIAYREAAKVWCVANLGRYVPGKLWSVAGMVLLAQREGVAAWVAGGSAVAIQALGLGTCVILITVTLPPGAFGLGLTLAALAAIATLGLLTWERAARRLALLLGGSAQFEALPVRSVIAAGSLTLLSWATYGVAFWCLARGMGIAGLGVSTAAGVFALGYLVGLLAVIVPGGLGVRELALVGQLTPLVGSGPAIGLSLVSRLVLTLAEVSAALVALALTRRSPENVLERSQR